MSMRHLFGFDHIPAGAFVPADYFDTRLKYFTADGGSPVGTITADHWVTSGGGTLFQAVVLPVYQDNPTHLVIGLRAKVNNGSTVVNSPLTLYLGGTHTGLFTAADLANGKLASADGDYISVDVNLTSGVIRRWIGNLELAPRSDIPVNTLKTGLWYVCHQGYANGYQSFAFRDVYIGDNADGIDVQVLGDRAVRSLPVKVATGASWSTPDSSPLVAALNKAWVAGAIDVTALNNVDNTALRVQFDAGASTPDIDAVQVELAASIAAPNTAIKVAREGDATGKTNTLSSTIKWGARSPIYQTKADGSKISSNDLKSMNFDISGA